MIHSSPVRLLTAGSSAIVLMGLAACQKSADTTTAGDESPTPATSNVAATDMSAPTSFDSLELKISYGIGTNIGTDLANNVDFELDQAALIAGLQDALSGADLRVPQADLQTAFQEMAQRQRDAAMVKVRENRAIAQKFLEDNSARAEVTATDSGLQYEVLATGDGAKPTTTNTVRVHYHGTLIDGTVFDSSVDRGEPIEFPVTGVIPGWTEALQLMSVGDKWKLFIPPALGYGDRGQGKIPPGAALVFEVELLEVK